VLHVAHSIVEHQAQGNDAHLHGLGENRLLGERMPAAPTGAYQELAPDWVCEVLSPSTLQTDRMLKLPLYARSGVPHVWLVDPIAQTLEVFRASGAHYLLLATYGGASLVRAEPFDAIELELAAVWGQP
jgi:Uma2 family endonuclease